MHETELPSVRYTAIEALGRIGDTSVLDDIVRYENDDSHHVRARAQKAIEILIHRR